MSAWGKAWRAAWGHAWGKISAVVPPVVPLIQGVWRRLPRRPAPPRPGWLAGQTTGTITAHGRLSGLVALEGAVRPWAVAAHGQLRGQGGLNARSRIPLLPSARGTLTEDDEMLFLLLAA